MDGFEFVDQKKKKKQKSLEKEKELRWACVDNLFVEIDQLIYGFTYIYIRS